ncbi:hypothetical protein VBI23_00275 [Streptococcus uberis]|uniref:hypothetical protein n=1 Tax=Streptococcus uberis TaxID=1349 RepID=UPI0018E19ADA|nr:hypothetical protein [Streptococcus uberis]MBI0907794.1 hypothetical protein [Streptococcus uberis]MCK1190164.1 hypothetical protein [Streptococcus uberis]MCK1191961.1 hypothetical protein [Streptococcus uberis]MCK1202717.1 hypothetical protein [Streptococcus uberis]MCK1208272.1 hypothetical protein [Streptococcus uberis]
MILTVVLMTLMMWYASMVVQGFAYLRKKGINMSINSHLALPFVMLKFHLNVFRNNKQKDRFKYLLIYVTNYKITIIFLAELILENIAMFEAVGYSPYISERKQEEKVSIIEKIRKLIKLPETENSFEEILSMA